MNRLKWLGNILLFSSLIIFYVLLAVSAWAQTAEKQGTIVGRVTTIEGGQLLRYVPQKKDWVVTVKDSPFSPTDALYSGDETKAEFIIPDSSLIRVGDNTQIELMELSRGVTQADAASGKVRFSNKSGEGVVRVTTPYGYVVGPAGTVFDLYVGENTLELVALQGTVDFIHDADQAKYQTTAGSSSIIANGRIVTSGPGETAEDWEHWNESRDRMLAKRNEAKSESAQHLPRRLHDYRTDLDQQGKWETVNYEGKSHGLWRPANVEQDWQPFTAGAWMDYDGDNAWVPQEPFGFITMHYGNWLWVANGWFWAPPGTGIGVSLGCDDCWYPGRVGWLYTDADIGWFPLAPSEPFYAINPWGPGIVMIDSANINNMIMNVKDFEFADHAVIVKQDSLYSANNYGPLRVMGLNSQAIANNFHAAPVLSGSVAKNFSENAQRFTVTKETPTFKPGTTALTRIAQNADTVKHVAGLDRSTILRTVAEAKQGQISTTAKLSPPSNGGKLVNPGGVKVAAKPANPAGVKVSGLPAVQRGEMHIARPQPLPPPTAVEKAAHKHSASSASQVGTNSPKKVSSVDSKSDSKSASASQKNTHIAKPKSQTAHSKQVAERSERTRGATSVSETEKTPIQRSGSTQVSSKSPGSSSTSQSSASKQESQSSTERDRQAQSSERATSGSQGSTSGSKVATSGTSMPVSQANQQKSSVGGQGPQSSFSGMENHGHGMGSGGHHCGRHC